MNIRYRHSPRTIRKSTFSFANVMLFLLPVASTRSINLVGELLFSDILVVICFLILLWRKRLRLNLPILRVLLPFWLVWFAGAMASDIVNASPMHNLLRGWAKLFFFALYLIVFFNLTDGKRNRLLIAISGLVLAVPLAVPQEFLDTAGDSYSEIAWKFGIGMMVTLSISIGLSLLGVSRRNTALAFIMLSPAHMFMGARSLFLTTFLSGLFAFSAHHIRSPKKRTRLALIGLIVLALGMSGGEIVYDRLVRSGLFGEDVLEKHLLQTSGGTNIILGGRSESLISLIAIHDSPIFGHGSWPESKSYYLLYLQIIQSQGRMASFDSAGSTTSFLIPSHSYLLGSWVEHGLSGASFWVTTFVLAARGLVLALFGRRTAQPHEIYLILALLWDILFSPFGNLTRCWAAIQIVLVSSFMQSEKTGIKTEPRTAISPSNQPLSSESAEITS